MANPIISNSTLITMAGLISAFMSYALNKIWDKFKGVKGVLLTILITLISLTVTLFGLLMASTVLFP